MGKTLDLPVESLGRRGGQSGANRELHEPGDIVYPKPAHDLQSMRFHRFDADAQQGSDLFRVQPFSYILENFSLAKAELLHSRAAGFAFSYRRVDIGSFNSSPNAISHGHRKLMGANRVENFIRRAQPYWKCAVGNDWLAREECIDLSFKFAIALRMDIPSHPRWAAVPP